MESKETDETSSGILDAEITGIKFGLASRQEICTASINECPITHSSQLSNPFLGLPLEFGRCESCGTSDLGKCEGHFGYIELPIPIYHPSHISELKRLLSSICLKCLKMRDNKAAIKGGIGERLLGSCCEDAALVSIRERKTSDGAYCLQLKLANKSRHHDGFWDFLAQYGFRYGVDLTRTLLPCEVAEMLKKIPKETLKKLAAKGYFPQDGYILRYLPVPPNCLSVPDVSDGVSVMSSDLSVSILKKVLKQVEIIKNSRSGTPNFESHEVEANELQTVVYQYLEMRGTAKASRDVDTRYGINKETSNSATKAWSEKIKTLFIRKGSGFSSRSVITGDAYKNVNEIGIPSDIAKRITFEETVTIHNIKYLQDLMDNKDEDRKGLCLAYKDGSSTFSLREGSKGYTLLKPGQVVYRRIMDGDTVFINRPPTTHKHSLQALSVYIHKDHTVKINPLICSPLGADFDGDCIHLFYPQSAAAKAEVLELFSVENQLLSSHSGNINLQLVTDALLSLKMLFKRYFFEKKAAQQLAMHAVSYLPQASILKAHGYCVSWTALQILQTALPAAFDCSGDRYLIKKSEVLKVDFNRDVMPSMVNEIVASIFFDKGPKEVLKFFNSLEPTLMESIYAEGFSVCLEDLCMSKHAISDIRKNVEMIAPVLYHVRSTHNELVQLQLENHIRLAKLPVSHFILKLSTFGDLIDSRSDAAISKIVQQIGFLGLQLSNKGKFYSQSLFEDMAALYDCKYPFDRTKYPPTKYGLIKSSFLSGLDPYELMAHSISTREIIVRSTRGLSEPGTLFKNLMAILRDVVICYDGTVRNICSNSIIQLEYGAMPGSNGQMLFPPGEPVGVLAATAMSNPAYKAVLDSSPNSNSSWEQMKEILLCKVNFRNEVVDRRVNLYLNDCDCGRRHCQENAGYAVQNHLRKISLKDAAIDFMIEYKDQQTVLEGSGIHAGLVGHIHLNGVQLKDLNVSMLDVLQKCQETLHQFRRKKKVGALFKKTVLSVSDSCSFHHLCPGKKSETPCLTFSWTAANDIHLESTSHVLSSMICPVLLETIIKGDPRISSAKITWITPDTSTWIRNSCPNEKGELAVEVTLEKTVCKRSGDAWRTVMDCCIPMLHLIDTRRSIPYGVKQVQELLGISCAFDQVIQRLSVSVTKVAKGLLKEHLILLADTMTCSGNLIGFNSGGYKALSRSLNVQVPFTEATLFTPRKCFERAAEKCHTDSLSSIVASCSWGKPVSVGTGSSFDIIWGPKEAELQLDSATDVYGFLHMVRGTNLEESDTACLGVEVDNLDPEMGEDLCHSPEDGNTNKPCFEDSAEFQDVSDPQGSKSSWDNVAANSNGPTGGWDASAWGKDKHTETNGSNTEQPNAWSSWGDGPKKTQSDASESGTSWGNKGIDVNTGGSSWEKGPEKAQDDASGPGDWNKNDALWGTKSKDVSAGSNNDQSNPWSGWKKDAPAMPKKTDSDSPSFGAWIKDDDASWGKNKDVDMGDSNNDQSKSWSKKTNADSSSFGAWNKDDASWGTKNKDVDMSGSNVEQSNAWSSWGKGSPAAPKKTQNDSSVSGDWNKDDSSWGKKKDSNIGGSSLGQGSSAAPKKTQNDSFVSGDWNKDDSSWGKKDSNIGGSSWGQGSPAAPKKTQNDSSGDWSKDDSSWGKKKDSNIGGSSWGQGSPAAPKKTQNDSSTSGDWSKDDSSWGKKKDSNIGGSSWGQGSPAAPKKTQNDSSTSGDWSKDDSSWSKKDSNIGGSSWGQGSPAAPKKTQNDSSLSGDWNKDDSSWGKKKDSNIGGSSWGQGSPAAPKKTQNDTSASGDWSEGDSSWGKKKDSNIGGSTMEQSNAWSNRGSDNKAEKQDTGDAGWGSSEKNEDKSAGGSWGGKENASDQRWDKMSEADGSNAKASQSNSWSDWKQPDKAETQDNTQSADGWNGGKAWEKKPEDAGQSENTWASSQKAEGFNNENPWRQQKKPFDGTRNRTPNPEWKLKKNNRVGPKPPEMMYGDSAASQLFTMTRQRLDMFTSEEQDILSEIEPIMKSLRRIMHQTGYNNADPFSAEDRDYIVDNVLNYHPDKAAKIGAGIDHITVDKHSSFQDSRCLYVVSTDGSRIDFSYRKCLEHFIKTKFPDLAEEFIGKYFKRRGGTRERSVAPEEGDANATQVDQSAAAVAEDK